MNVRPLGKQGPLKGVLRYVSQEHSFDFEAASPTELQECVGTAGVTSLSIGTLQIEVAIESGLVLFAWGLLPMARWVYDRIGEPRPSVSGVRIESNQPLRPGVSLKLADVGEWAAKFDEVSGWLRLARNSTRRSAVEAAVATGVVLGMTDDELDAVWLQPVVE